MANCNILNKSSADASPCSERQQARKEFYSALARGPAVFSACPPEKPHKSGGEAVASPPLSAVPTQSHRTGRQSGVHSPLPLQTAHGVKREMLNAKNHSSLVL